jgi:hypothetical protein
LRRPINDKNEGKTQREREREREKEMVLSPIYGLEFSNMSYTKIKTTSNM